MDVKGFEVSGSEAPVPLEHGQVSRRVQCVRCLAGFHYLNGIGWQQALSWDAATEEGV